MPVVTRLGKHRNYAYQLNRLILTPNVHRNLGNRFLTTKGFLKYAVPASIFSWAVIVTLACWLILVSVRIIGGQAFMNDLYRFSFLKSHEGQRKLPRELNCKITA